MLQHKYLISVVGPTGIGKTALSIQLATYFNTEIISADSRQFYKEIPIGTAAPSASELQAAKHHFIHNKSITDTYSVGSFEKDALTKLTQLFKTHQIVIMVGGSGLYVDAVTTGLDAFPKIDKAIRIALNNTLETEGLEALQEILKQKDPQTYNTIALQNPHRVIRALEVCIGSGKPYSSFLNKTASNRPFKTLTIGLTAPRDIIYNRINNRVDAMMAAGLLEEVTKLKDQAHLNALNTVGYKEIFNYLNGDCSLESAVSTIKMNTRRFAKRQLTWFKRNSNTLWFDYNTDISKIIEAINTRISK
ncbi:tRNA (adenosine(37)-N6)-dimethylallyltransferase MiaA [Bizionia sediminis]|uniref:tRNA dimethylallyltransferase n=1 Tax=Bizionia sediminis TaxID=1737064 RepID=A0ABW5KUB0_9FLAO